MAVLTSVALAWTAWLRFSPVPTEPPAVGSPMPALRLRDIGTTRPLVLLGLRGKVVWITFWSAADVNAPATLHDLDRVWRRLRSRSKFALIAAAVEADQGEAVRAAVGSAGTSLPVYLAAPATRDAFGADGARLPLNILVDDEGRIAAVAQGRTPQTLDRLVEQAESFLEEIEPLGKTRYAARPTPRAPLPAPTTPAWNTRLSRLAP